MDTTNMVYFTGLKLISHTCVMLCQCSTCANGPNMERDCCCLVAANVQADLDNSCAVYMDDVRAMPHYTPDTTTLI